MKPLIVREHKRYGFYALFALNILLLFCNYALQISIPWLAFVAILVFTALIGDMDELIAVCVCCIAWSQAIKSHYVIICCCVIILLKYGKKIKIDLGIIPIILIVIWEFFHCFSGNVNIQSMISFVCLYMFFILIFFIRDMKTIDYSFIMRNYAVAVLGVCCVLIFRLFIHSDFSLDKFFLDMQRLGQADEEIGGLVVNPNSLGILCVLAVGCLMQVRSTGEKRTLDIFLMVSILVLGALTCSRTYLGCLIILCVFSIVVSDRGIKYKLGFLFGCIILLLISLFLLHLIFPEVLDMFIARLTAEDITSGRSDLFMEYNNYLLSSPNVLIWGLGAINFDEKIMRLSISFNVPHNGIQEILLAWGIIGLVLFIAMIWVMIRRSKQENSHQSLANYALLIVLLAKIMVGQVITSHYTMLSFVLIYLSLCQDCSSEKIKKFIIR